MGIATQILEKKTFPFLFKKPERLFWQDVSLKPLPTMYDLPSENPEEPGLPDQFHDFQADLLSDSYRLNDYPADQIFTAADMNLYFDPHHLNWYKRPDWFVVMGVPSLYHGQDLRLSYVIWNEAVSPFIVAEFLSPSTKDEDLGQTKSEKGKPPTKWKVYEEILKIPYYILFDRRTNKLQGFRLTHGKYQPIDLVDGRLWIPELKIGLGLWQGKYQGAKRKWLRWVDIEGRWIPTPLEKAESLMEDERLAKEQAEQHVLQERLVKERLAAKLRELGIDPATVV